MKKMTQEQMRDIAQKILLFPTASILSQIESVL